MHCLQIEWPIAFFYVMCKKHIESVMIIGKQLFRVTDAAQRKSWLVSIYRMASSFPGPFPWLEATEKPLGTRLIEWITDHAWGEIPWICSIVLFVCLGTLSRSVISVMIRNQNTVNIHQFKPNKLQVNSWKIFFQKRDLSLQRPASVLVGPASMNWNASVDSSDNQEWTLLSKTTLQTVYSSFCLLREAKEIEDITR